MSRTPIRCHYCREPLAFIRHTGAIQRLDGVARRWDGPGVCWLTCPVCRHERRVTLRDEREAA